MSHVANVLIRSPNWIGDQILAFPFYYYLRKAYPNARIVSVCVPWVQAVQFRSLVDDVFVLPVPLTRGWRDKWDALEKGARMMKDVMAREAGSWDLGIALPNSFSTAWLLYRSGVRQRRGYVADGRGFLLNQRVPWEKKEIHHRADAYLKLLPESAAIEKSAVEFWGVPPASELDDGIPGVLSQFDAGRDWPDAEPLEPPQEPYWVLAPGSTAESRRWPVQKFAELARAIRAEKGWKGLIVGGAAESQFAAQLTDDPQLNLFDWTGRGTVASYWKVFRNARMSVCNDSGLAHVASLCGSPVQVIWGGGDPRRTQPIGPGKVQVTINPVECWPCERNTCSQELTQKLSCLRGISPDAVWSEIKSGIRPV